MGEIRFLESHEEGACSVLGASARQIAPLDRDREGAMAEGRGKREALGLSAEDVLPEGPLHKVISLVPGPSRGSVSLVCRKFHALEAQTRHRLVFQVPRPHAPSSSGKGPEGSPTASKSLDARISASPLAPTADELAASADKGHSQLHPPSEAACSTACIAPASPASSLDTSAPPAGRSTVPPSPRLAPSLSSPSLRGEAFPGPSAPAHQRAFRDLASDIQGGAFGPLDADEKHPKLLEALPDWARHQHAASPRLQPLGPLESEETRPLPSVASPRTASARNGANPQVLAQPQSQRPWPAQSQSRPWHAPSHAPAPQAPADDCVGPLVPVPSYLSDAESSFDFDPRRTHAATPAHGAPSVPSDGECSEDDCSPTGTLGPSLQGTGVGSRRLGALETREGRAGARRGGGVALARVVRQGRAPVEPGEVESARQAVTGGDCVPCSSVCGTQAQSSAHLWGAQASGPLREADLPAQSSTRLPPESPDHSPRVFSGTPEPSPRARGLSPAGPFSQPGPRLALARPSLSLLFPGSSSGGLERDRDRAKERGAEQTSSDVRQADRGVGAEREGAQQGARGGEGETERERERERERDVEQVRPEEQLTRLLSRFTQIRTLVLHNLNPGEGGSGGDPLPLDGRLLSIVAVLAPNLEELHLSGHTLGWMVNDDGLCAVARGCPNLRALVVHHWVVGRRAMAALADAGRLQSLEMDFFARDMATGPHRTVSEVARCSSLTSLHLRYCNNEDVRALAEGCPRLQRLTLLFSVLGSSLATLGLRCADLQELTLRSCDTNPPDDPLLCLAQHCTSLRALSLHAGHAATEGGLQRLVAACPNLTRLSLEFLPLPLSLVSIAPQLAGIKELTLQWIQATDADLLALSRHCKRITMLVLSLFLNVTDDGVAALLEGCGATLKVLLLRVKDMTDGVLGRLGGCCPALERLTLVASNITSAGIAAMLRGGPSGTRPQLARLRRLRLVDCTSLDNSALEHVAQSCPRLEGLGIKGCTRVTPETVQQLVASCPHLTRLEVDTPGLAPAFLEEASARGVEIVDSVPGP